jgi:uncharacterized protein
VTDENTRANVADDLARSDESLRAARMLLDGGLLRDAESRIYYAAFHAVSALLLTAGLEPRAHAGVSQLFNLHFVKTGRLDPGDSRLFARLQKYRMEADYSAAFVVTRDAVEEDFAACSAFIGRVRAAIASALP